MDAIKRAAKTAPPGTSGLLLEAWTPGEVYGVAADWADASAPVYMYTSDGKWEPNGCQVADYGHAPEEALTDEIRATIEASGEDLDEEDIYELLTSSINFGKKGSNA